jgi:hypothetical protein
VSKRIVSLIAWSVGLWMLAAYPAHRWGGEVQLLYSTVALVLCLLPAAGTLAWLDGVAEPSSEQRMLIALGGTGLRMTVVLGVGLALYSLVPFFGRASFWLWVLAFYLLTLMLEIALLLTVHPRSSDDKQWSRSRG